jgi:excisionase family DNA binding protein
VADTQAGGRLSGSKFARSEAAKYLGISRSWLDKKRLDGNGPPYLKLGRRVIYERSDLDAWATSKRRFQTTAVE